MKLLVTGRSGQLVRSLVERSSEQRAFEIVCVGRPEIDLEQPGSLGAAIRAISPDLVVNAAAYTAVDQAEDEPERAFRVNADAAGEAAAAARHVGAAIVQISTDYVFDGSSSQAYREDAATAPLGVYGRSKLAGEEQVQTANQDHLILRTSWVYSPFGRNFVKTMLRQAQDRDEVRVVADQRGSPTSALDIADAVLAIAQDWKGGGRTGIGQTFHFAGAGSCSWAELAEEIFRRSREHGGPSAEVRPIATSEFPTRARRPANSVLDCSRFESSFRFPMRDWRQSLAAVVNRLTASEEPELSERAGSG